MLMIRRDVVRSTFARLMLLCFVAVWCAALGPAAYAQTPQSAVVHHDLVVTLDPPNHRLKVRDRIRIPAVVVAATISLNADLSVQAAAGGPRLVTTRSRVPGGDTGMDRDVAGVPVNVYRVEGANPGQDLTLELQYEGAINFSVLQSGGEYARSFSQSPGLIEARGVYLAGSTYWVPRVDDALVTYTLAVELPAGWRSV